MKFKNSGVIINAEELKPFAPVLKTWVKFVTRFSDTFPHIDACYWFNERANISVLAAAAWKTSSKWIALEEFSTVKHGVDGDEKNGRCDLYCALENHEASFAFEAKQAWQKIGRRVPNRLAEVNSKLNDAWDDVSKLQRTQGAVRVAACFVAPRLFATEADENGGVNACLQGWMEELKEDVSFDALAWVFPESSTDLTGTRGRLYPGVCLILKVRKRAKKSAKG